MRRGAAYHIGISSPADRGPLAKVKDAREALAKAAAIVNGNLVVQSSIRRHNWNKR